MNDKTIKTLLELNNHFYRENAASFSATRQEPWSGWQQIPKLLQDQLEGNGALSVFDLACGNLRFEQFLLSSLPLKRLDVHAVDNCTTLLETPLAPALQANSHVQIHRQELDIIRSLMNERPPKQCYTAPKCDLCVCFGFMHHVPGQALRTQVLDSLIAQCKSGGVVVISFWQYLKDSKLRAKAMAAHTMAAQKYPELQLDANDFLLGWKGAEHQFRYCHSFTDEEIDALAGATSATHGCQVLSRFVADGKSGNLNSYLVLRVLD